MANIVLFWVSLLGESDEEMGKEMSHTLDNVAGGRPRGRRHMWRDLVDFWSCCKEVSWPGLP